METRANYDREQIIELDVDIGNMMIAISDLIDLDLKLRSHDNAHLTQDKFAKLVRDRIKGFMQACVNINETMYTQNNDQ